MIEELDGILNNSLIEQIKVCLFRMCSENKDFIEFSIRVRKDRSREDITKQINAILLELNFDYWIDSVTYNSELDLVNYKLLRDKSELYYN